MARLQLEDDQPVPFAQKVVDILDLTLPSDSLSSPRDAAKSLNALYPDHRPADSTEYRESGGSFLWWFWDLFHDLARQVPHDSPENGRMAAVVKELHDLPAKAVNLGDEWGIVQLWSDLPLLGPVLREKWDSDPRAPEGADKKQRFLNLQTYTARIAGLGLAPLESYAIWALTAALEGEMTPIRGAPDEVNSDPAAVEDVAFKISVATTWILHAGGILYGRDEEVRGTEGGPLWKLDKKEAAKLRRKYKGTQGLSPERWQLWKERFGVFRDSEKVDEGTRSLAAVAVDAMESIEKEKR
ncbi:hypothetical protein F5B20DRAFT_534938 [Whalleya microplaca]|nr:hypothetical protein F5B20DRAFT_534938 [Whalleya microplaca]